MRFKRPRLIWLLPIFVFALGAIAVLTAGEERQRILRDMERAFKAHVESVAQLVRLGAENAADSTAYIYDLALEDLNDVARLLKDRPRTADRAGLAKALNLAVWVSVPASSDGVFDGVWGGVPPEERAAVAAEVLGQESGTLVDGGAVRKSRLYCLWSAQAEAKDILCKDSSSLAGYRKRAGLGPLLRRVANWSVLYAAIQDEGAILAASSPSLVLPPVGEDPFLLNVFKAEPRRLDFRRYSWNGKRLFEGAVVFPLADGTTALLRVGVDSTAIDEMESRTELRQRVVGSVAAALLMLSVFAAVVFSRRQRRSEEAERLLAAREEENRHWQAIGRMAATVAHEVRTPLSTLKMIGQRLRKEFTVPDQDAAEFKELLALLDSESERVNMVVSEFLELGKPLALSRKDVDLKELIEGCLTPLKLRASGEGKVLESGPVPSVLVSADPERFHQIIRNLAGNALDAVGAGGRVCIGAEKLKGGFIVRITDDGPGMEAGALARAQQPFMTTKARGTGLGLPLARRLVEAHGGRMEIVSQVGAGTEVTLFFPDRNPGLPEKGAQ